MTFANSINHDPTANSATRAITWQVTDQYATGATATTTLTVTPVNDPPTLTAVVDNPTFTEKGSAALLFANVAASTVEAGQSLVQLQVTVSGLADGASEVLVVDGSLVALTNGNQVTNTANGFDVAVVQANGTATVTVTAAAGHFSAAAAQTLIDGLAYENTSLDPTAGTGRTVTLSLIQDNGGTGNGGADTTGLSLASQVTLHPVNDAPTLSAAALNSCFTEAGADVALFNEAVVSTIEYGQTIKTLTLTVGNLADGAAELLRVDGTEVTLTNGASATTATDGAHVGVAVSGTTATVTISSANGLTTAQAQSLIDGLAYRNTSLDPSFAAPRVVTLTSIQDSGGTLYGGQDTSSGLHLVSDVRVIAVNNAPTISKAVGTDVATGTATLVEGLTMSLPGFSVADVDSSGRSEQVTVSADAGVVSLNATDGITFTGASSGASVVMRGTIAALNRALTSLTYTATPSANAGTTTITLAIDDLGNTGSEGHNAALTASATTTVQRLPLPPVVLPVSPPTVSSTPVTPTPTPSSTEVPVVTIIHVDMTSTSTPTPTPTPTPVQTDTGRTAPTTATSLVPLSATLSAPGDGGFRVVVVADQAKAAVGEAVVVAKPLTEVDQSGTVNFSIPADAFAVSNANSVVTLSATQADGKALPSWLSFNAASGSFEGTPPPGAKAVEIKVVARDQSGHEAAQVFKLAIDGGGKQGALSDHRMVHLAAFAGKPGLSHQLRSATRSHPLTRHATTMLHAANQLVRHS